MNMNTSTIFILALAIGVIAGLRAMTAPAVVSWAAHLKWLDLQHSSLAFLGSTVAVYILTAAAIVELGVDKLPQTPRRTEAVGLIARFALGGLSEGRGLALRLGREPKAQAKLRDHTLWMDGAQQPAAIYDRSKLEAGDVIKGPAIVTEMDSTTLIETRHIGTVDAFGNILITPESKA